MEQQQPAPLSLKVVAGLFFLFGLGSAVEVLIRLAQGSIYLNIGVLGLFIGAGLLRYDRGWRTCALVFLWLGMIGFPLAAVLLLATPLPLSFTLFGQQMGEAPKGAGVAVAALGFALALWQYWVLTRPRVRRLFGVPVVQPAAADGTTGVEPRLRDGGG
jgi:hypothetical protein